MRFKCIKDTVLNGEQKHVGDVIDSQVDIRQYGKDWELYVEPCEVTVDVPKPRITRTRK